MKAQEDSLRNCKFAINSKPLVECPENGKLGEIFRHELVTYFALIKKSEFAQIKLIFESERHPVSK